MLMGVLGVLFLFLVDNISLKYLVAVFCLPSFLPSSFVLSSFIFIIHDPIQFHTFHLTVISLLYLLIENRHLAFFFSIDFLKHVDQSFYSISHIICRVILWHHVTILLLNILFKAFNIRCWALLNQLLYRGHIHFLLLP